MTSTHAARHTPTVLLALEQTEERSRVRVALELAACRVLAEAATAQDAVALAVALRPDIALVGLDLPGGGVSAAFDMNTRATQTAVVMLSDTHADDLLFDSLRAGVVGFVTRDDELRLLGPALHGVLAGRPALAPSAVARLLDEFRAPGRCRFARQSPAARRLSPREWEIMELLSGGATTEDVARRLFVSPTTVRVHVSSTLRKLRVKDRSSAFRLLRGPN